MPCAPLGCSRGSAFIFLFLGQCADDFLGTGRVCTITGILLGFPAAIYSLYRQLKYFKLV